MVNPADTLQHLETSWTLYDEPYYGASSVVPPQRQTRVISITSGKGGVGKTHIAINLAYALQAMGARVLVMDADLGLANIDVLLGLVPRFTLQHVLSGEKSLAEVLLYDPGGMVVIPASSGTQELAHLTDCQRLQLLTALDDFDHGVDFLLIDTGAGISSNVTFFNLAAQEILVVVTPEPASITDAYALIKVLATKYLEKKFKLIINNVGNQAEGKDVFRRLSKVTEQCLHVSLDYLGCVLHDTAFTQAARQQRPLLELYPRSGAARCFRELAEHILAIPDSLHDRGNIQFFWHQAMTKCQ